MRIRFKRQKLRDLYYKGEGAEEYSEAVVDAFSKTVNIIEAALDERDLYALKSLHFEKLEGQRGNRGERSLRLNDQWRLIVLLDRDDEGKLVVIVDLEKHYQKA